MDVLTCSCTLGSAHYHTPVAQATNFYQVAQPALIDWDCVRITSMLWFTRINFWLGQPSPGKM